MAGQFWYPHHWSDLASEAFVQAPADHDSHGFGAGFVARQEDRDRALEDYLNTLVTAVRPNLAFGQASTLTVSTSPPLPMPVAGTIDGASFALGTAGSTNTVVAVLVNGVSKFTVTIPSGSTSVVTVTGQAVVVAQYDRVTVGVTTAGTGARDLGGFVHTI